MFAPRSSPPSPPAWAACGRPRTRRGPGTCGSGSWASRGRPDRRTCGPRPGAWPRGSSGSRARPGAGVRAARTTPGPGPAAEAGGRRGVARACRSRRAPCLPGPRRPRRAGPRRAGPGAARRPSWPSRSGGDAHPRRRRALGRLRARSDARRQPVLDLGVAARALDVVPADVEIVDEGVVLVARELLRLVVAGEAALPRRLPFAVDDVEVALLAGDAAASDVVVVEPDRAHDAVALRRPVAAGAARDGRQRPPLLHPLEMAEEARGLCHLDVGADHDLRVAARAPELPTAPHPFEVRLVVEDDAALEGDLAVQEPPVVAARPETARVLDLREGLGAVGLRRPLHHLRDGLVLDPDGVAQTRRVVALDARDLAVLGRLPGSDVGLHDVAGVAQERARADVPQPDERGPADHDRDAQHDQQGAAAPPAPPCRDVRHGLLRAHLSAVAMISQMRAMPMARALRPTTREKLRSQSGGGSARSASRRPPARRRSYSSGWSRRNSSSSTRPVKMTGSMGNFSGRRWPLKKWIVKMKPTASRASSLWTMIATLKIQPGSMRAKKVGNHRSSPVAPMMETPQKTAQ